MMPAPLRVLIAEDEPLARDRVRRLMKTETGFQIIAEATDGHQAIELTRRHRPDILLLDILMPGPNGFEILAALGTEFPFAVIFLTAHREHAVRAFDARAVDYVLKPFTRERLRQALHRAKARCEPRRELLQTLRATSDTPPKRIALRSGSSSLVIPVAEIIYAVSANARCQICTIRETVTINESLASLHKRLPAERFVRISRFTVVNLDCVKALKPKSNGDQDLFLRNGTTLTLTRTRRAEVINLLALRP